MISTMELICGIAAVLLAMYYYFSAKFNYWKDRGVPGPKPMVPFGNFMAHTLGQMSLVEYAMRLYQKYKEEPMVGIFVRRTPTLVINDAELVKDVLIKDFPMFANRGFLENKVADPLDQHLFVMDASSWRPLRTQLSPVFTSGKLKGTFSLILDCARQLEEYLDYLVAKREPVDVRDLAAKFATDVIGSCAFGIDMNSLSDAESEFRKMGKEVFAKDLTAVLRFRVKECIPKLFDLLGYVLPYNELTKFFIKITSDTLEYREKNNIVRPDFMNTLLELRRHPEKVSDIELTEMVLAAQAFAFFGAGFETSSGTISHALYELALNQDIQEKLRQEINEYHTKYNGDWKYETLKEMVYLDKIFHETLRKYPVFAFLIREATGDYTFRGTKVSITKGTKVWIPIYAFHWDPSIYPEPEKFIPERFDEDVKRTRHAMHYLPFGDGPRNCIGARFAIFQSKVGIISIIRNYKVDVCEKTPIPYEYHPLAFVLAPKNDLYLKLTKVEK
ncbi:probable cytochrome P450 6a14 [Hylaeus volcanicus]|uniref:probable cytochrome P450 6a14 n=1 Tax=Hylaeus volcanicus TaxID=313075 RepID=UPI0023B81A90|nr:probable cytochrome P450 6a14 [Hylaeus volcanicus]